MPSMTAATPPPDDAARAHARAAWRGLADRLATVTPAQLARITLGTVVGILLVGLAAGTWPALLPFAAGGLIAYAVLPVVDALDRIMPRALAAALTMLAAVAAVIAVLVVVVPPLTAAILALVSTLPPPEQLGPRLDEALSGLPPDAREIVDPIAVAVIQTIQQGLDGASGSLGTIVPGVLNALLGVVGAVFGLLILPAWLLGLLTDQRRTRAAIDRRLPAASRADTWAVIHILDRAAGMYLRGFVVVAFLVGFVTYVALSVMAELGGPTYPGQLALAVFAGAVQVIPELGPVLGLIPVLLIATVDPERALAYLVVYVGARLLVSWVVGGRLLESRIGVHPLILIPGVVVLGQLGPFWLLLSAPILAGGSDLIRYIHGRLSEPPRPAGLLPGEPAPASAAAVSTVPVPPIYRPHRPGPPAFETPTPEVTAHG